MASNPQFKAQGERLKLLLIHIKMTARDLSRIAGFSENTAYKICSGLDPMSERTASKICYFLEREKGIVVNRQWLLTGDGEMLSDKYPAKTYPNIDSGIEEAAEDNPAEDGIDWRKKYLELLEAHTRLQGEFNALLVKMLQK